METHNPIFHTLYISVRILKSLILISDLSEIEAVGKNKDFSILEMHVQKCPYVRYTCITIVHFP